MPQTTLAYSNEMFNDVKKKWEYLSPLDKDFQDREQRLIDKEAEYQELVEDLAQKKIIQDSIFTILEDEKQEEEILQQAFLIGLEVKKPEMSNKLIVWMCERKYSAHFSKFLYYLSPEAFKVFFTEVENIGIESDLITSTLMEILEYVSNNKVTYAAKAFLDVKKFDEFYQEYILNELSKFPEFKEVIEKLYNDNDEYFEDALEAQRGVSLLLVKLEEEGLSYLRNPNCIAFSETGQRDLNRHGNYNEYQHIIKVYENNMPQYHESVDTSKNIIDKDYIAPLLIGIKEAGTGTPEIIPWMIKNFDAQYNESRWRLHDHLSYYFDARDDDQWYEINDALYDAWNEGDNVSLYKELPKDLQEKISTQLIQGFWNKWIEEHGYPKDKKKRINLYDGSYYDILVELDARAHEPRRGITRNFHNELIIATGEYFPLDSYGFYTTLKKHKDVWKKYLEENREKYEEGRWFRYGRYVDIEPIPLLSKEVNHNINTPVSKDKAPKTGRYRATLPNEHKQAKQLEGDPHSYARFKKDDTFTYEGLEDYDLSEIIWSYLGE